MRSNIFSTIYAKFATRALVRIVHFYVLSSVTREKSPNVHKCCPKMISIEKLKILAPTQKLPKTVGDLGKLIVAKDFKKLPKVQ